MKITFGVLQPGELILVKVGIMQPAPWKIPIFLGGLSSLPMHPHPSKYVCPLARCKHFHGEMRKILLLCAAKVSDKRIRFCYMSPLNITPNNWIKSFIATGGDVLKHSSKGDVWQTLQIGALQRGSESLWLVWGSQGWWLKMLVSVIIVAGFFLSFGSFSLKKFTDNSTKNRIVA